MMLLNCSSHGHEEEKGKGRGPRFSFSSRPPCSTSIELGSSFSGSTASEQCHARDQDLHTQHSDDSFPSIVSAIQAAAATEEMLEEGMRLGGYGQRISNNSGLMFVPQVSNTGYLWATFLLHSPLVCKAPKKRPKISNPACGIMGGQQI